MLMEGIILPLSTGGDGILVLTSGGSTPEPRGSEGAGSGPQRCFASDGSTFVRTKVDGKSATPFGPDHRCCPIGHDQG